MCAKFFFLLALGAFAAMPVRAQEEDEEMLETTELGKQNQYRNFVSPRGTFAADVPTTGWQVMEEQTPYGSAAHFFGPTEEGGLWRAALHVHFIDKAQPGFVPIDDAVKRERRSEAHSERNSTSVRRVRVARASARRFEVTETKLLPADRLPATPVVLHHYSAYIPAGDGYFIVKLSTSRETYLGHKMLFERVLKTFRVLGYN